MSPRPLSFFKFKLRDIRWSIVLTVIITASILGWLVSFSMGSDVEATVSNYSKTITFIRVEPHSEIGMAYPVIPNDIIVAVESMQYVRKVYKVYMFKLAFVSSDISLGGLPLGNVTMFLHNPAAVLGLGELAPFIVDVKSGRLPVNGSEIATVEGGYKVGDEIEVAFNNTIVKVRISGFLTRSLLSPALIIVHKDFLLSVPGGKDVLDEALKGSCTVLFVEVDSIYNVEEVADDLRKLLEKSTVEFGIVYDEYLLKKTIELSDRGTLTVRLLNFGTLSFSALLIALVSYLGINVRRWEVGLLRSLGFSNNEIKAAYLLYSLAIAALGAATAFLVVYTVGDPVKNLILNALNLSDMISATTPHLTLTTTLLTFALAASISAASILISIGLALRRPVEDQLREF
jgi:ABC-type antimicrobial peptide transport system permease subunit